MNKRMVLLVVLSGMVVPVWSVNCDALDAEQEEARPQSPDETAIDPALLAPVWDPQTGLKSKEIRPEEGESYYAILAQARDIDQSKLVKAAVRFRTERIEAFRKAYEERTREMLRQAEASRMADPQKYQQLRQSAQDYLYVQKLKYDKYRENPEEFPSFVDLYRHEELYHGKLVTFRGHIRKLLTYEGGDNERGIETLHEAWLFTDDSQNNPAVVVCTSIPPGMMQEFKKSEVLDNVSATGYFFKMYIYDSQKGAQFAPLLLAQRLEWQPIEGASITPSLRQPWLYAGVVGVILLVVAVLRRVSRRDREFRSTTLQPVSESPPEDLNAVIAAAEAAEAEEISADAHRTPNVESSQDAE